MAGLLKRMKKMKTKKKIKKGLKYFLSAIIIGAALYLNVVAGKYIYDEGHYFLESPECLSEETFVFDNKEMNFAVIAKKKGERNYLDIKQDVTCAEFKAELESYSPKTTFDGICVFLGCVLIFFEVGIGLLVLLLYYLAALWLKFIYNPVVRWINNGEDNRKYQEMETNDYLQILYENSKQKEDAE